MIMRTYSQLRTKLTRFHIGMFLLLLCLVGATVTINVSAAQTVEPVQALFEYVSPRPGAALVSAETTIVLRPQTGNSLQLRDNLTVRVSGSQSGPHTGTLNLASDQETLIFQPARPFAHDETVNVTITMRQPGSRAAVTEYAFYTAPPAPPVTQAPLLESLIGDDVKGNSAESIEARNYRTAPANIPSFSADGPGTGTGDGYFFVGYFGYSDFTGTDAFIMLLDNNAEPVYYQPMAPYLALLDLKKQPNGTITYFNPDPAHRRYYVVNNSYQIIGSYAAGNGYVTDVHDVQLLDNGNALLMIYDFQRVDMSQLVDGGNPEAVVVGCIMQEVDAAGNVIFEWRSWDEMSILDTNQDLTADQIDYVHCNSVELDNDGNWLISSRHLDEVTKISRQTGNIIWRLGGKASDFTFTNDDGFLFQHDARRLPNGHITVHDNGSASERRYSRGVEFKLNLNNMTATRMWEYRNDPDIFGIAMGNNQRLPNGNTVIGWGTSFDPMASEVSADGTLLLEINSPPGTGSYRVFRFPWQGNPTWPPRLVADSDGAAIMLYFSWNGATEVSAYQIYAGQTPTPTTLIDTVPRDGFETVFEYVPPTEGVWYFRVRPLDTEGNQMAFSNTAAALPNSLPTFLPTIGR
jgi:hypothetical protein